MVIGRILFNMGRRRMVGKREGGRRRMSLWV
jgi:hypothetical protein